MLAVRSSRWASIFLALSWGFLSKCCAAQLSYGCGGAQTVRLSPCANDLLRMPEVGVNDKTNIPGVDRVFVVHYKNLRSRQQELQRHLDVEGIQAIWLAGSFDRSLVTERVSTCLFGAPQPQWVVDSSALGTVMPQGVQANVWAHFTVFAEMVRQGWERVLVLEDDVVLPPAGLRSTVQHSLECAQATQGRTDFIHLAKNDEAYVVTQAGARRLLSLLSHEPAMDNAPSQYAYIPATVDLLIFGLERCYMADTVPEPYLHAATGFHVGQLQQLCKRFSSSRCSKPLFHHDVQQWWGHSGVGSWLQDKQVPVYARDARRLGDKLRGQGRPPLPSGGNKCALLEGQDYVHWLEATGNTPF